MEKQLESGLFIVETEEVIPKPTPTSQLPKGVKCRSCERRSLDSVIPPLCYRTREGWTIHDPTCKHSRYVLCPECEDKEEYPGCPICGRQEEYT